MMSKLVPTNQLMLISDNEFHDIFGMLNEEIAIDCRVISF